jgi:hypothetical protein
MYQIANDLVTSAKGVEQTEISPHTSNNHLHLGESATGL